MDEDPLKLLRESLLDMAAIAAEHMEDHESELEQLGQLVGLDAETLVYLGASIAAARAGRSYSECAIVGIILGIRLEQARTQADL